MSSPCSKCGAPTSYPGDAHCAVFGALGVPPFVGVRGVPISPDTELKFNITITSPHAEALLAVLQAARECIEPNIELTDAISRFDALVKKGS